MCDSLSIEVCQEAFHSHFIFNKPLILIVDVYDGDITFPLVSLAFLFLHIISWETGDPQETRGLRLKDVRREDDAHWEYEFAE